VDTRRRSLRGVSLAVCGAALSSAAPLPALSAQVSRGTIELGAARLTQPAVPRTDAVTVSAGVHHEAPRFALTAFGGITLAADDRSTTQGTLSASLLDRPVRRFRWEIGGAVTAFDQGALPLTRGAYLFGREHFTIGPLRGWAAAAIGGVEEVEWWSPTRSAELVTWFANRFARVTASAVVVDTRSEPYGPAGSVITDPITYTDGSIGGTWVIRKRAEFDARAGLRVISRGALTASGRGTKPFAGVEASLWVTPQVALVGAVGRQLSDLARGTPDTRYAAVSFRFSLRSPAPSPHPTPRLPQVDRPPLLLVSDTSGAPALVVTSTSAASLELAASFTNWEPVALVQRGDRWELDRRIPSGAHRVLVRINGGPWIVPANLPATADDFGGTVGILTVP
jgi:hypothetical protein